MSISKPFLACTVQENIPRELEALTQRTRTTISDADKMLGIDLLIEVTCDLMDNCFGDIFAELSLLNPSKELDDASAVIERLQTKARHYIHWLGAYLSNSRLPPVIAHYNLLLHSVDLGQGVKSYMAFSISPEFALELKEALVNLENGVIKDMDEMVDLLARVFNETMVPLLIKPKDLMKFNFVVNKTLDGVIGIAKMLNKHMLHKLAPSIPTNQYSVIARHLSQFLYT